MLTLGTASFYARASATIGGVRARESAPVSSAQ